VRGDPGDATLRSPARGRRGREAAPPEYRFHYVDEEYGGWYDRPPGMGGTPSPAKGTVSKLDYHVVTMCRELLAN